MEAPRAAGAGSRGASTGHGQAGIHPPKSGEESWRALIERALADLRASARTRFHLAELESRRALHISAGAIVLGALAVLLMVTAWFALLAAAVIWAAAEGFLPHLVLLIIAALCALGGWLSLRSVRAAVARIRFDATIRAFKGRSDAAGYTTGDRTEDVSGGL